LSKRLCTRAKRRRSAGETKRFEKRAYAHEVCEHGCAENVATSPTETYICTFPFHLQRCLRAYHPTTMLMVSIRTRSTRRFIRTPIIVLYRCRCETALLLRKPTRCPTGRRPFLDRCARGTRGFGAAGDRSDDDNVYVTFNDALGGRGEGRCLEGCGLRQGYRCGGADNGPRDTAVAVTRRQPVRRSRKIRSRCTSARPRQSDDR
jgi:hypothetical protein